MADKKKNDKFTWKKGDIVWEKAPKKAQKSDKKSGKKPASGKK